MQRNQNPIAATPKNVVITLTALAVSTFAWTAGAKAESVAVITAENPAQPGAFSLNFGVFGGVASSMITSTNYELDVDPRLGTARFVNYLQHVEPLTLPGGFNTGAITVEVVADSSTGVYDPLTGVFTTTELYAVHFEGDLSAFNLTSPVLLSSSSTGTLVLDRTVGGEVRMNWNGQGELANPFDPLGSIPFSYVCEVNTLFSPTPVNVVGLALRPDVQRLGLRRGVERSLTNKLDHALRALNHERPVLAIHRLIAFKREVRGLRGRVIPRDAAARLIEGANDSIDLIRLTSPGSVANDLRDDDK